VFGLLVHGYLMLVIRFLY